MWMMSPEERSIRTEGYGCKCHILNMSGNYNMPFDMLKKTHRCKKCKHYLDPLIAFDQFGQFGVLLELFVNSLFAYFSFPFVTSDNITIIV